MFGLVGYMLLSVAVIKFIDHYQPSSISKTPLVTPPTLSFIGSLVAVIPLRYASSSQSLSHLRPDVFVRCTSIAATYTGEGVALQN
jgi:hypothetical protein